MSILYKTVRNVRFVFFRKNSIDLHQPVTDRKAITYSYIFYRYCDEEHLLHEDVEHSALRKKIEVTAGWLIAMMERQYDVIIAMLLCKQIAGIWSRPAYEKLPRHMNSPKKLWTMVTRSK